MTIAGERDNALAFMFRFVNAMLIKHEFFNQNDLLFDFVGQIIQFIIFPNHGGAVVFREISFPRLCTCASYLAGNVPVKGEHVPG